jgi:uncharacterized protein with GYD domain
LPRFKRLLAPVTGTYSGGAQPWDHDIGTDRPSASSPAVGHRPTEEVAGPTYVTLIRYTEQGVRTFKDLPQRLEETRQAGEALGAKLIGYYLTMGQYDAIAISEAPDDHAIAKLALAAGARGNVRTETLRAFTEEEARSIAADL